jgi:hypothetical protein
LGVMGKQALDDDADLRKRELAREALEGKPI